MDPTKLTGLLVSDRQYKLRRTLLLSFGSFGMTVFFLPKVLREQMPDFYKQYVWNGYVKQFLYPMTLTLLVSEH